MLAPLAAVVLFLAAIVAAFGYLRLEEVEREQEAVRRDVEYTQQRLRLRLLVPDEDRGRQAGLERGADRRVREVARREAGARRGRVARQALKRGREEGVSFLCAYVEGALVHVARAIRADTPQLRQAARRWSANQTAATTKVASATSTVFTRCTRLQASKAW